MNLHDTKIDPSPARITGIALLWLSFVAAPALGQTTPPPLIRAEVGSTLTAEMLADLPLADNVYSVLETTQSEVISDRFNGSGLNVGESARAGAFLGSWSQTSFHVGSFDVSDPSGGGAPLLFPELMFWDSVSVATGLMPTDFNTPGLGVTLVPKRPGSMWTTTIRGSLSGGSLASTTPAGIAPPISRLSDYGTAAALVSGPLSSRLGIAAGGSWAAASKFERERSPAADSDLASGFAHLVYTPSSHTDLKVLGWVQRTTVPFAYRQLFQPVATTADRAVHLQSTLDRRLDSGLAWQLAGGVTDRSRENELAGVSAVTADRLTDGPMPSIAALAVGSQSTGRWSLNWRVRPAVAGNSQRHTLEAGAGIERTFLRLSDQFSGTIGELVDTTPARRWFFTHPDADSHRRAITIDAFATDRIALSPRATLDTGVRFESVTGRAAGGLNGVQWLTVLPRAVLRWQFGNKTLVGGYRRSANRLNLDVLAYGDPNGQTAIVTRLLSAPIATAAIIDRVGPGTGGNATFSTLDADVKRPVTDEFVIGLESQRFKWLLVGLTGLARREANLLGVVDVGVPLTSYSTIGIPDPGHDFASPDDDQILTVYNRLPASYGRNQYVLTNSGEQAATAYALKLWAAGSTDKVSVLFGATASMANGSAANRGYGPLENDQDLVGELLTDPNAATFGRGRLFADRAFTIKWTTTYKFPADIRVGVIARYQDGQPFARLVSALGVNQGAELIRAYPNAGNRFTFTGTLDIRLQKGFAIGRRHVDGIIDFYNLATRGNEVEEYTVSGPNFRTPTAIEPPRSIHIGLRLTL